MTRKYFLVLLLTFPSNGLILTRSQQLLCGDIRWHIVQYCEYIPMVLVQVVQQEVAKFLANICGGRSCKWLERVRRFSPWCS